MNVVSHASLGVLKWLCVGAFGVAWLGSAAGSSGQTPSVRVSSVQSNGWVHIRGQGAGLGDPIVTLLASSNLIQWQTIAVLQGHTFEFADPVSPKLPRRFYRFSALPYNPTNDWKNQVLAPSDYFHARGPNGEGWVKFAITTNEPARVYYADTHAFVLHYDFASTRLAPFVGMDNEQFNRVSLYNTGRQVYLGAVMMPSYLMNPPIYEYGIQFVAQDPLPREVVRDLFELVKSTVVSSQPQPFTAFYMPTYEQNGSAQANRSWLEANGVPVSSPDRWAQGDTCYSMGWAVGTLKFFSATNIAAAYADGRLLPTDILLTDGVPSELPYVAGIITLAPATPNSHVAILARSYNVPFVHLLNTNDHARVLQLVGREVVLQLSDPERSPVAGRTMPCGVDIYTVDPTVGAGLKSEILSIRNAPPIDITPIARFGGYTASTDNLVPADIRFFGGKAANYGLLRRTIPSNAPVAIGISFDLWTDFMAQTLTSGRTLRQEISNRLAGYSYPADIPAIKIALNAIRSLIRQNTVFTAAQQQAIINALGVFDSGRNIRFRSSTNVEDTEAFTGAGLYDSFSGCLEDDLDADTVGPSHCDPTEQDERGVFRAIRRVYASFYNDNAYLERLRHHIDENSVGMAMLVHHSTPDDIEMANGVAAVTSRVDFNPYAREWRFDAQLVSQKGAISVANPEGNALPEVVNAYEADGNLYAELKQPSNLIPLGEYVMDWQTNYLQLGTLLSRVTDAYRQMTGKPGQFLLDFEYKKIRPGWLEVKQVREIPLPATNLVERFLLDEPTVFVTHQGGGYDVFGTHRMKSRWTLRTRNFRFNQTNLASTLYTDVSIEHLNGNRVETLTGAITSFPGYSNFIAHFRYPDVYTIQHYDYWRMSSAEGVANVTLATQFPLPNGLLAPALGNLLLTIKDSQVVATVHYDHQVPYIVSDNTTRTRDTDGISLLVDDTSPDHEPAGGATFRFTNGTSVVTVAIAYEVGDYFKYMYNPPLIGKMRTRIDGLTTERIVLTNYYSQTFGAGHLGAGHQFLFEPRLEPGLSASILSQLDAMDIRFIRVSQPGNWKVLQFMGRNGTLRGFGS